jgi:hypothetical protein
VLQDALPGFVTAVQAVADEPRYHLDIESDDIESDDIEAEVARLLALGAIEVSSCLALS